MVRGKENKVDFLQWLVKFQLQLAPYEARLRRDGWDTFETLKGPLKGPLKGHSKMPILLCHRSVLRHCIEDLERGQISR